MTGSPTPTPQSEPVPTTSQVETFVLNQPKNATGQTTGSLPEVTQSPKNGTIVYSMCTSYTGDANNAYGKVCSVSYLLQHGSATANWYIGNKVSGSANDTDWYDSLDELRGYTYWDDNSTAVNWDPQSTVKRGDCKTYNSSVGYDGSSVSQSETVCPEEIDPDLSRSDASLAGAVWYGCDTNNDVEGVPSTDIVHLPKGTDTVGHVHIHMDWGVC
jgi:hypothetical protein